jgi:hypothetical protein
MVIAKIISLVQYIERRRSIDLGTLIPLVLFLFGIFFLLYILHARFNDYFTGLRTNRDFPFGEEELFRYEAFQDNTIDDDEDLERAEFA